jgi:hypothetical protein
MKKPPQGTALHHAFIDNPFWRREKASRFDHFSLSAIALARLY